MTVMGAVHKTGFLVFLVFTSAYWAWQQFPPTGGAAAAGAYPWLIGSAIGGVVVGLVTGFQKHWAMITSPIYALLEGVFLGVVSALFEASFPGIAIQAVGLTAGTLFALLLAYRSGLIAATENFKLGVTAATGAIMLVYLVSWVLRMFGVSMPFLHDNGIVGIGIRPCTGAIFVLVAAWRLDLLLVGALAAFAMAAGTGAFVSLVAVSTVTARGATLLAAGVERAGLLVPTLQLVAGGAIVLVSVAFLVATLVPV